MVHASGQKVESGSVATTWLRTIGARLLSSRATTDANRGCFIRGEKRGWECRSRPGPSAAYASSAESTAAVS